MARISNKQVYKTVEPTASDYVVGTDAEDLNKTKTFTMQGIAEFVGGNVTVGVGSLNGLVGAVTLSAGVGLVLTEDGNDLTLSLSTPDFVESINGLDGVITVQGSTNIGVTDDGTDTITLTALNLAKTNESNTFTNDQTLNRSLSVAGGVFDVDFDTQRVGVNNSTPLYPLDIVGDTSITGTTGDVLTLNSPSEVGENYILFNNSLGTDKGWVGYRGASDVLQLRSLLGSVNIIADTSVTLSYGGVTRLETTGSGVQITGDLTVGDVTASSIVITGGTSSDFLKADGSLDSTSYQDITEKGQADGYVPLNSLSKIENTFLPNDLERTTNKGAANGYAPLDSGAKIPLANIPDSVLGQVTYEGTWDVNNNLPLLANPPAADTKGEYYVCSSSGTQFGITFQTGDWIISNGTAWEKVDNTDAVTSVFGRLGNVVANSTDYENFYVDFTSNQSISGIKTFGLDALRIVSGGASNLKTIFRNTPAGVHQDVGSNTLGFNVNNDLYFTKGETIDFNGAVLSYDNTGIRTYTLPDASGTFAFTNVNNNFSVGQTINGDTTINGHFQVPGLIEFNNTTLNTLLGSGAGANMATTGSLRNTAVGYEALYNNTTGDNNTANGYAALRFNTTGGDNTANGYQALRDNTTGYSNTANGSAALGDNTTGYSNTANGYQALFNNTTGYSNTANGSRALYYNTTGDNNTANGYFALLSNTTGEYNTALGYNTGNGITTGSANTIIGANVAGLPATLSNTIIIADGDGNQRIRVDNSGNVLINKTTGTEKLDVNGNVQATSFIGSGASLTSLNASNITTGTLADARLSNNVALKDVDNNFSVGQTIGGNAIINGNVGIGTSSPAAKLESKAFGAGAVNAAMFSNSESLANSEVRVFLYSGGNTTRGGYLGLINESASGQPASMTFATSAGFAAPTERMRIDSSGNVGIGTTSPAAKLEVNGNIYTTSNTNFLLFGTNPAVNPYIQGDVNNGLFFGTGNSSRLSIDSSGNVGIGTSSPSEKLHMQDTVNGYVGLRMQGVGATYGTSDWILYSSRESSTDFFGIYNNNSTGGSVGYKLRIYKDGLIETGGNLTLGVGGSNTFILDGGYTDQVFVGSNSTGFYLFRGNGSDALPIGIGTSDTTLTTIYSDTEIEGTITATSFLTSSDYRLKENVVPMTGALDRVDALKPARFNFIADTDKTVDGFLAHEVQDIVPEAVTGTKDAMREEEYEIEPAVLDDEGNVITEAVTGTRSVPDYQGIDQSKLVPLLVGAIKEQQSIINNLITRIENLEK